MLRGAFCIIGVSYAIFSLSANVEIMLAKDSQDPREAIVLLDHAGQLFPLKPAFRTVSAHYQIMLVAAGLEDFRESAIRSVEKALETMPNSTYLRKQHEGLRR